MSETLSKDLLIQNKKGLHARASARFVQTVEAFDVAMTVTKDGINVGGTSIMGLMMLAASKGCTIAVSAKGTDAQAAMDAIEILINDKFGEGE